MTDWPQVRAQFPILQQQVNGKPLIYFDSAATSQKPLRIKWINELMDENGNYLPHLLPVDPTLH